MRYTRDRYSLYVHNFYGIMARLFDDHNLDELHELLNEKHSELFQVGMDSSTALHTKFYDKYREGWPEMVNAYEKFIKQVIAPQYEEDFLYQRFPTCRFHIPLNVAVGAFHNDAEFNHPAGEINYIIPLTDSDDTASVYLESKPRKEDFEPMKLRLGEYISFNGNTLTHGNQKNKTGKTRVSMDFRILPISKYKPNEEKESMTTNTKFVENQYYKRFAK